MISISFDQYQNDVFAFAHFEEKGRVTDENKTNRWQFCYLLSISSNAFFGWTVSFLSLIIESKLFFKLFLNFLPVIFIIIYRHRSYFSFHYLLYIFDGIFSFLNHFFFFFVSFSFGINLVNLRLIAYDIGFTLWN